jgi:tRNA(fMet)-specific endonuclease VapC
MPGEILADTNVIIAVYKGQPAILTRLSGASEIYVASVSVGELIFGALKSTNQARNLERIDDLIASSVVLPCDADTARCYAGIKHELKHKGRPIPDNDLWIAALAVQHDLLLLTFDKHFGEISQLAAELCKKNAQFSDRVAAHAFPVLS